MTLHRLSLCLWLQHQDIWIDKIPTMLFLSFQSCVEKPHCTCGKRKWNKICEHSHAQTTPSHSWLWYKSPSSFYLESCQHTVCSCCHGWITARWITVLQTWGPDTWYFTHLHSERGPAGEQCRGSAIPAVLCQENVVLFSAKGQLSDLLLTYTPMFQKPVRFVCFVSQVQVWQNTFFFFFWLPVWTLWL